MRKFQKITFEQFKKDTNLDENYYKDLKIPCRGTKQAAGYDFYTIDDVTLNPGEIKKIPTGIKAAMNENEVLNVYVRSSVGFKYNVRLCNQVGIIDADYYNNENNEGHIFVALQNHGDKIFTVNKGDRLVQGVFFNYLTVDNEVLIDNSRSGGIGSTSK